MINKLRVFSVVLNEMELVKPSNSNQGGWSFTKGYFDL